MNDANRFEQEIERFYNWNANCLYNQLKEVQPYSFLHNAVYRKAIDQGAIDRLINHFEGREEYEKCGFLFNWKKEALVWVKRTEKSNQQP